jgi:hypothetical protein
MIARMSSDPLADLPVGGHVKRPEGLIWRRRVDWSPADYQFIAEQYRKLARGYEAIAGAVDEERRHRFPLAKVKADEA